MTRHLFPWLHKKIFFVIVHYRKFHIFKLRDRPSYDIQLVYVKKDKAE